ncbi:MAG TPA: tetraacyldisaccharide 4'-kinase [Candidatus Acidoferrales bacterium]|nr:tetraacyldisaccharide 4'-kinase [Candidatus Acidoferrales bacterium]
MKTKGIYFLYRTIQAFGLPVLLLYFLWRGLRNRGYWQSVPQRLGFLPLSFRQTGPGAIWLHAVSVGEVLACEELVRRLRQEFPHSAVFVSTSTLAGRAMAVEKMKGMASGVFYAPVDYVFAVRRVLRSLQPAMVVVAETEIWPNLFREVKRTSAGLAIVNGRISDGAITRYRRFRWFFAAVLPAVDATLAQTGEMAQRFVSLGAPAERVQAAGNLKYDFEAQAADAGSPAMQFLARLKPGKVWIAASTMGPAAAGDVDEDDAVIAAFRELAAGHRGLVLILAPRKPERFAVVAGKLEAAGLPFMRRSALSLSGLNQPDLNQPDLNQDSREHRLLLLDTIGELSGLFGAADVVFMGGTLAHRGGHNILEPARFGKAVIVGPHMENFQAIAAEFELAGAAVPVGGAAELASAVGRLLDDPEAAGEIGRRALACAEARRGATVRAVSEIRELLTPPRHRQAMPRFAILWALARVWEWGGRRKLARNSAQQRKLDVPVISIGNLTMGGTGKTPCVLRVAEVLRRNGHRPGILTRGYGRSSPIGHMAVAPGARTRTETSGDEPQIFIRSGLAPVGIGADRFQTGRLLIKEFHPDVMLLDDGFQHRKLARNLDIVLIDALNPFGGGDVFPAGRLREPVAGLARADVVLITRSDVSDLPPAIERAVRRSKPHMPVFRASMEPEAWVEHKTGARFDPAQAPFGRAGVFCGLGNPQSFLRTLQRMGVPVAGSVEFEDHHRYRARELRCLAYQLRKQGATALVTTEKDSVNLCDGCDELVAPSRIYWLKVRMRIEGEEELVKEIESRLG